MITDTPSGATINFLISINTDFTFNIFKMSYTYFCLSRTEIRISALHFIVVCLNVLNLEFKFYFFLFLSDITLLELLVKLLYRMLSLDMFLYLFLSLKSMFNFEVITDFYATIKIIEIPCIL